MVDVVKEGEEEIKLLLVVVAVVVVVVVKVEEILAVVEVEIVLAVGGGTIHLNCVSLHLPPPHCMKGEPEPCNDDPPDT